MCATRQRGRREPRWMSFASLITVLVLLVFVSTTSAVLLNPSQQHRRALKVQDEKATNPLKALEHDAGSGSRRVQPTESKLRGPGSWPPRCISKCGRCWPCKPVHISIQPGLSMPLEYYPEAWRCKCGNKLFMP